MSLGKVSTKFKSGVSQLQSVGGIQRTIVQLGLGVALGAILDLIFQYIMSNFVYPAIDDPATPVGTHVRLNGFSIFPNMVATDGTPFMNYDDVLLLVISVFMIFTKRLWFALGFFLGFYSSSYMGLYATLKLPLGTRDPPYP